MYNPQLETFVCVVEAGSFNKAAERLYISPPAVIKQINLLEENLDLQLFDAHSPRACPHRGRAFPLPRRQIYHPVLQGFRYPGQECYAGGGKVIRIGASPMTPAQVLVDLWPRLQGYCPNVKFQAGTF